MVLFDILFGDGTDEMARERFNRERAEYEKRENEREEYRKMMIETFGDSYDPDVDDYADDYLGKRDLERENNYTKTMHVALKPPKGKEAVLSWRIIGGPGSATYTHYSKEMSEREKMFQGMADFFNRYMAKYEVILRHSELVHRLTETDCETEELVKVEEKIIRTIPEWQKIIRWVSEVYRPGESPSSSLSQFDINAKPLKADNKIREGDCVYWVDETEWRDDTSGQPGVKRVTKWQ